MLTSCLVRSPKGEVANDEVCDGVCVESGVPVSCGDLCGKHRGVVTDNVDPQRVGRIRARVPSVLGEQVSGWAMPCMPYGADPADVPAIGANVWVEFEQGDPARPIWTGCWWSSPVETGVDAERERSGAPPGRRPKHRRGRSG